MKPERSSWSSGISNRRSNWSKDTRSSRRSCKQDSSRLRLGRLKSSIAWHGLTLRGQNLAASFFFLDHIPKSERSTPQLLSSVSEVFPFLF